MTKLIHLNSETPGNTPKLTDLDFGRLAINHADGKVFILNGDASALRVLLSTPDTTSTTLVTSVNGSKPDAAGNVQIVIPAYSVDSVNGKTGTVVIEAQDITSGTFSPDRLGGRDGSSSAGGSYLLILKPDGTSEWANALPSNIVLTPGSLPVADSSNLGAVKSGSVVTVASDGTLGLDPTSLDLSEGTF